MARDMLGFAAIALDWERAFLGPLYDWFSAIQGKGSDEATRDAKGIDELASQPPWKVGKATAT